MGLKTTFMHNGVFSNLNQVIAHYAPGNPRIFLENIDPLLPVPVLLADQPDLIDFLANGLTDPRVRDQLFPFDQPALQDGRLPQLSFDADKTTMRWPLLQGVLSYVMVRGNLSDLVDVDHDGLPDLGYGDCVSGSDPNTADGGAIRGLGVTSAIKPRVPAVSCP